MICRYDIRWIGTMTSKFTKVKKQRGENHKLADEAQAAIL